MATSKASLKVELPKPGEDKPRFSRVGIITAVGFGLGVLWPRLAGVHLVPSAPAEEVAGVSSAAEEAAPAGPGDPTPPAAAVAPAPTAEPATKPPPTDVSDRLEIGELQITSCRDAEGHRKNECGSLDLESVTKARIQSLVTCPAAEGAEGTLSLGLELDFKKNKVVDYVSGKSTTLPDSTANGLMECAKKEFGSATLEGLEHTYSQYTAFYLVKLKQPGEKAGADVTEASGHATVSWEVAIIRAEAKDGAIVARILRGTRVVVTGRKDDWYRVKYDAKGSEGWVFKTAIGM